jgi:hypothetical protein
MPHYLREGNKHSSISLEVQAAVYRVTVPGFAVGESGETGKRIRRTPVRKPIFSCS